MKPVGKVQEGVLAALVEHTLWYGDGVGCGWTWGNDYQTKKVLDTLVKRKLVATRAEPLLSGRVATVYRPTAEGKALAERWRVERVAARLWAKHEKSLAKLGSE